MEPSGRGVKTQTARTNVSTHQTYGLSENTRKSMDDLHYWFEPVCAISIPIVLKCMNLVLKQFEDSVGGVTASERVCKRVLDQVYANLAGLVIECIDDESKIRRGHGCQGRRQFATEECVVTDGEIDLGGRSSQESIGVVSSRSTVSRSRQELDSFRTTPVAISTTTRSSVPRYPTPLPSQMVLSRHASQTNVRPRKSFLQ